jgi:hypothetical protein
MYRATADNLEMARTLGRYASMRGLTPRAPALDTQWRALLVGWQVGEGAADMAQAWLDGYQTHCDKVAAQILEVADDADASGD